MVSTQVSIPGYQVSEKIYHGSRTLVYRAFRENDLLPVVIKLLKNPYPNFSELVQFRNQYTITKNLHFPGIIQTYSLEAYENGYMLVMEDFGGISIKDYFDSRQIQDVTFFQEFLQVAISLCDILDFLYRRNIIHKDIKPANILINPDTKQVKLVDFSIASLLPRETQTIISPNLLEGTLAYISPEQTGRMNRGIDYRADFYSLGVTFYELLTCKLPFPSDDAMELVHSHIAKQAPILENIGGTFPTLADIIMKLMAKNAENRYQSALGLKYDLEKCLVQLQETGKITDFEIAKRDICDRFIIPDKLYGRETEVEKLLEAFARVSVGNSELMLVAGCSGIGKTAVINEVHKPIVQQRGYFIKGKFDQFNRNIPFSAFVQACRDLMGQLLTESDKQLQQWRDKIIEALGDNAQVIIEVIPELERIIGKQPPAPELSGSAAQNRFNLLFQIFIKLFTHQEHPLVLFLDDLQWADSASLKLIQLLISDINQGYLLLIGAYRDNEVSTAHPLMLMLDEIQRNAAVINTITLTALSSWNLHQLVADTLSCTEDLALPLANLVYQQTGGNPFFTTQFLKALHQDKLIIFNYDEGYWQCDIIQVQQQTLTYDVVEFMTLQLQRLPQSTQDLLKLAACIGNQFDLETLAIVSEQSQIETAAYLWNALQEGLILPQSEIYKFFVGSEHQTVSQENTEIFTYKFLHDRVQQAAYFLIPDEQKQNVHYHIGQLLLRKISSEAREERIFELVNQLNYGTTLIVEQAQLDELAQLNLTACRKARAATAYQAAREYAKFGLQILGKEAWQRQYQITLVLHELAAEIASLLGDLPQMNQLIEAVIDHAQTPLDTVQVYQVKIQSLTSQNQLLEAIATGKFILQKLGISLPNHPTQEDIQQARQEITAIIGDRSVEELIHLPKMVDGEKLAIMQIATSLIPACYMTGSPLYLLIVPLQVKLSILFGNCLFSAYSYVSYAFQLSTTWQDMGIAQKFGQLAYQLASEPEAKNIRAATFIVLGGYFYHCTAHLQETLPILREGCQAGLETGNLEFFGYNVQNFGVNAYWSSKSLPEYESQIRAYYQQLQEFNLVTSSNHCLIYWEAALTLLGKSEEKVCLRQDGYAEQIVTEALATNDLWRLFQFYMYRAGLNFLLADVKRSQKDAFQARQYLTGCVGSAAEPIFYFYDSLIALTEIAEFPSESDNHWQRVQENQAILQQWAHHAPMNYLHKWQLVEAEKHRICEQNIEAMEFYEIAIQSAKKHEYIGEEALGNELAAKFYLELGKEKVAQAYMQEAYYCYARWGAKAKTDNLEQDYPRLLQPILQQRKLNLNPLETITTIAFPVSSSSTYTSTASSTNISVALDLSSVLKAAQTISSTIELDQLVTSLTQIILENSGAKKSALIIPQKTTWQVKAITFINDQNNSPSQIQTILDSQLLDDCQDIPVKIINYVKNTQQTIVIDNLQTDILGVIGKYMLENQPKSVLCTPIISQGHLVGIIYLENHLTAGVFTSDRLKVIQMLSVQAAISLENARLYQESQEKAQQLKQSLKQQKTLFNVVTQIRESLDLGAIFRAVTQNMRRILNVSRVGIYQFHLGENYNYGEFIAEDVLPEFTSALAVKIQDHCFGENYANLYKQGRICAMPDVQTAEVLDCHRAILQQFDVRASLVVPILQNHELWGLLCIHQCDRSREWESSEIEFAKQIAAQMGVALQQTDLLLETRQQATQLEETLQNLQETQLQLVQNEKMSALGNLVAGVAHEMNNPLGFIAASLQQAKPTVADITQHLKLYQASLTNPGEEILEHAEEIDLDYCLEDVPKMIDAMVMACNRLKNISTSLRTFSRADKDYKVSFNLHEGIDSTILILKHRLKANELRPAIEVITEYGNLPQVECFPGQLNQVFMNILANAIDALDECNIGRNFEEITANPNKITIKTSVENNQVKITIADNGKGMTEDVKNRIFDHLFTTKEVGKGTGFGLAIARQIVEEKHGGNIAVNSILGLGTEFMITIPI
ncbi:AAA family ATPase [Calothrix sp. UHCC 0171]|uniref:trifunctional serine/threonine-protein kinase/ATP-binding protein/sensor histidine kinase n=1 Tax=Calothrix sp. UHCC 0171 TaxID=3110245 RepID=UPI002B217B15|nr:AAA family ATPase [Calothrix sp. UHCC 0171]MEA5571388.1 AAA family ATPase [Calothrix sp. UHCC 0171]